MVFGTVSKMVSSLPVEAIIRALDLQCRMLKDDLDHSRLVLDEDVSSILQFNQFIGTVKNGQASFRAKLLPLDHLEFYRETLIKLIQAKELPAATMEQFTKAFPVS
ncbi:MAG TPA: hypothetical protein VH280_21925 [Verrucomicrobiae bacterium]|jgi:hypothetical protein|nr:hypothetical protein [Verrucomicrobiae bacterium]